MIQKVSLFFTGRKNLFSVNVQSYFLAILVQISANVLVLHRPEMQRQNPVSEGEVT